MGAHLLAQSRRWLPWVAVLVSTSAFGQGMLLPTEGGAGPLGVKYQRVAVEIKDGTAVTRVEQVFVNDAPRPLEAHYVFPLPKGAALSEFYLWINGQKTKGEVLEKGKATGIYEGIVRRLQDPGLLEYLDHDVFRARVFPVPAKGEQRIELSFSQVLELSSGVYRYHYPLGAGGRGAPPLKVRQDFTFSANLASGVPLRSIYSPTHPLQVARKGEHAAVVGLEQGAGADISKDLELYYTVSEQSVGFSLLAFKEGAEPGYFLALVAPRFELQKDEVLGKRVTFVIDTSGSMAGERMRLAKDTLKYCVGRLNPQDRFNVVRFATDVEALFEQPSPVGSESVKRAAAFVDGMEALGGTAIDEALQRALQDGADPQGKGPHLIVFITDGHPTIGETDEANIARNAANSNKARSRVFTFGVGEDLNARLLDRIAAEGAGVSDFARGGKELELKVSSLYDKISHPVLADLAVDLSSIGAFDVYPRRLPDLFRGSQVVVTGRFRQTGDAKLRLTGKVNGDTRTFDFGTTLPKERRSEAFIPRLWAIRKVGYLLEEIRLRGEKPELKEEVVALGKRFGIVTPYTSYLVVEDAPVPTARSGEPAPPPRIWSDRAGNGSLPRPSRDFAPARPASPASAAEPKDEEASGAFAGKGASDALKKADGRTGVAVSLKTKEMKEELRAPSGTEPVRSAGGRSYVWRGGGWVDSEAVASPGRQLRVKYLSAAYFALVRARPELRAGLALGDRVVVKVGESKSVVVSPSEGEESAAKLLAFLDR